ncbi:MAG TPA: glycosyltransferase family 9 protein [Burkholderiales bacterium]|nr:glycosyltransferase family 9 protein [Burkholderiales bacterium]
MLPVRSVLVINVARIGDTLLVTPALRALAARWPDAAITFLGHPKRVEVMQHLPFLAAAGPISKHRARWLGWLSGHRWDLGLVYGFDRALVSYALRATRDVVAFRQGNPALDSRLLRCVEPPPFQSDHAVPMRLSLTRALGVPDAGLRLSYTVTPEERAAARALLSQKGLRDARPLIGLQVRAFPTKAWRDWPIEHFAALCRRIAERWPGAHFLLFGGGEDRSRTQELTDRLPPGRASSLAGVLSLRASAAVMSELHLFIGLDSGPTHIAGALDVPLIGLYHCLTPSRLLKPLERPAVHVVDHPLAHGCNPETPMGDIPVDAVWRKVLEALPAP